MRPLVPPDPPLADGDLLLRPIGLESDLAAIRDVYADPQVQKWMGWSEGLTSYDEAHANIERAAGEWERGTWAVYRIVDAATDGVVGGVNLRFVGHETAEVSYFLLAAARGRGLATRAVRLVTRWAFDELGIERVSLRVHPDNLASRRVAERAGFRREGVERASSAWPDGTRFDSIVYSRLPSDP